MVNFLIASTVILAVLLGWLWVQRRYRQFAADNPQLGPFRDERGGCGGCSCHGGSCQAKD